MTDKKTVKKQTTKHFNSMMELVEKMPEKLIPFHQGQMAEATILSIGKNKILVDLGGLLTGIIPEKEFSVDVEDLKPGQKVNAYVMNIENENGYAILSLRKADKEKLWESLEEKVNNGDLVSVRVSSANRGGLMCIYGDLEGFLPVSQLSSTHYPKVEGADKDKIYSKLQQIVGTSLKVKVLNFDKNNGKLIFSEKAAGDPDQEEKLADFQIGDKVKGKVTGIVSFGLFIDLGGIEGLIHISEISWDRVDSIEGKFKIGDNVEAVVTNIENGRISLSIKQLSPDPWESVAKKIKIGDKVEGEIASITPYGAFVKLPEGLEGLLHVKEFPDSALEGREALIEGRKYQFKIISVELTSHKIALSMREEK